MESAISPCNLRRTLEDDLALWTTLTAQERSRATHWFASRPEEERVAILAKGDREILPRLQSVNPSRATSPHIWYAALILAIRQEGFDLIRKRGYRVQGHKDFEKFDALRQGTLQSLGKRRKSPLRQTLLAYWGEVKTLKDGGTGFLLISRYLNRAHNVKVSPSYIARIWHEIEGSYALP